MNLFGFDVGRDGLVALVKNEVTLLKVKRLGAGPGGAVGTVDLLAAQRGTQQQDATGGATADRPVVERPAGFVDGKARQIEVRTVGHARHAGLFRTRTDVVLEDAELSGPALKIWLNATRRPDRISPRSLLPAFRWDRLNKGVGRVRTMLVRVRLKRPWFTSGEGERLGVVLWPPNLFEIDPVLLGYDLIPRPLDDLGRSLMAISTFSDDQLGPGGPFVTRWGADPIRGGPTPDGWLLSSANFPDCVDWTGAPVPSSDQVASGPGRKADEARAEGPRPDGVLVQDVLMPLPRDHEGGVDTHGSAEDFMRVSLLTYEPRFDVEQEYWYADVHIDAGKVPDPFLRLGLVRFQAHAPAALQVSEPIVQWVEILPQRTVTVDRALVPRALDPKGTAVPELTRLTVSVDGAGSTAAFPKSDYPDKMQVPVMSMRIVQRTRSPSGLWCESTLPDVVGDDCAVEDLVPTIGDDGLRWRGEFIVLSRTLAHSLGGLSLSVHERELRRPSSYPVEPVEDAATGAVRSGPRFAATFDLAGL